MVKQDLINALKLDISNNDSTKKTIITIANYAKKVTQAERCSLFIFNREKDQLRSVYADGVKANIVLKSNIGIVGYAFHKKMTILENNTKTSKLFFKSVDQKTNYKTETILAVPLIKDNQRLGVIELLNKKDGFNNTDKEYIEIFAKILVSELLPKTPLPKKTITEDPHTSQSSIQEIFDTYLDTKKLYLMENGSAYYKIMDMKRDYFIPADQCYQLDESHKKIDIHYHTISNEFLSLSMLVKLHASAQEVLISESVHQEEFIPYKLEADD